jgi:hypothetical protein
MEVYPRLPQSLYVKKHHHGGKSGNNKDPSMLNIKMQITARKRFFFIPASFPCLIVVISDVIILSCSGISDVPLRYQ